MRSVGVALFGLIGLVALGAAPAAAQPGALVPDAGAGVDARVTGAPLPPPPMPNRDRLMFGDVPHRKSRTAALSASLVGTITGGAMSVEGLAVTGFNPSRSGTALLLAPLVLGPSAGHFYAHDLSTFLWLAVRAGGAALLVRSTNACNDLAISGPCDENHDDRRALLDAGLGLLALGIVGDIVTAPGAADRYNESHHQMTVAPIIVPSGGGLGLVGSW
ncbi:MAG TPA: hypothetical protein VGM88_12115 [Kofleriaceae bacterium]|jgi:hypothetical protein